MSAMPRYVPSASTLWRRSSHSTGMNNCVETADPGPGSVAVRDSKRTAGPALLFTSAAWSSFLRGLGDEGFRPLDGSCRRCADRS